MNNNLYVMGLDIKLRVLCVYVRYSSTEFSLLPHEMLLD